MLPSSIEAEQAVLGSILIDPDALVLVSDFLNAEDFYRDAHRSIYEVMHYLLERQEPADIISVSDELGRRNVHLDLKRDNFFYLQSLVNCIPTSGNAEMYAHMIVEKAILRRLLHAAGTIAASAQNDTAEEAILHAEEAIFAISQRQHTATYAPIADVVSRCMSKMEMVSQKRGSIIGVPTGYVDLDRMLGGLRRKALYILAARPAQGKSALALNIGYHAATNGYKVAFFSLEMGDEELAFRLISMESGVESRRLQDGWIEDEDWPKVEDAMTRISESQMVIDETGGLSIAMLRSRVRQIQAKQGLDFIIVDYLQLLNAKKDGRPIENRVQEISEISRNLKMIAKELDVPVLALAQLSRAVEYRASKIPQLSDLRESGSIEADADCVIGLYRDIVYNPATENPNAADLIILKNRSGPTGEIRLHFVPSKTKFYNMMVSPSEE